MVSNNLSRRQLIRAAAVGGTIGVAGCSSGENSGNTGTDNGSTGDSGGNTTGNNSSSGNESSGGRGMQILQNFEHGMSTGGLTYYPVQWGNELGFFQEEQVSVDAFIGMGGGASMQQLAAGNFQINTNAMDSTVLAQVDGGNVAQIGVWSGLSHGLVAQTQYESFDDLPEEINLGISSPTSGSTGAAYMMLQRNGIDPGRVTEVSIGGSRDRYLAVSNKDVDIGASILDVALEAEKDENTRILQWAFEAAPDHHYMGTTVYEPWLDQSDANYETAVRHTTATLRTIDYAYKNQDELRSWAVGRDYLAEDIADRYMELSFGDGGFNRNVGDVGVQPSTVVNNNVETLVTTGALNEGEFSNPDSITRLDVYRDAVSRLEEQYGIQPQSSSTSNSTAANSTATENGN